MTVRNWASRKGHKPQLCHGEPKIMQGKDRNIPHMFDHCADPVVHFLLLKASMALLTVPQPLPHQYRA